MLKPKLGRYLEWHGNRIRVVVRVPPALIEKTGRTKLREVLETRDAMEAEREKVDVVRRLKAELRGERVAAIQTPLTEEALRWREVARQATVGHETEEAAAWALDDRIDRVRAEHGHEAAMAFAAVAAGTATPLASLLDRWFAEKKFSVGYKGDIQRTVGRLEQWCRSTAIQATVEAITRAAAGRFIHERYVEPQVDAKTANKDISCLNSYWKWMRKREGVKDNPWSEQRLDEANRSREATETSDDKRPFTDDEVRKLLAGIRLRREWEFSFFAALSGLRVHEIAGLRIKDCADNKIAVTKSKTPSGVRTIPAHSLLRPLIAQLSKGKNPTDYLFEGLPEQRAGSKRDRSAPVSQSFTRERRRLGIEEKATDRQRQSNIDFHSWRRWFVRKAVAALEKGGAGYTPWTIAHVIGHKVEDGTIEGQALPLGMTMGVYAGASSWEAMVACVKAVALPKSAPTRRDDLAAQPGHHRPTIKRRPRGNSSAQRRAEM